jgi:hypothetical protein
VSVQHLQPTLATADPPRAIVVLDTLFMILRRDPRVHAAFESVWARVSSAPVPVAALYLEVDRDLEILRDVVRILKLQPFWWMADVLLFLFRADVLHQEIQFVEPAFSAREPGELAVDFQRRVKAEQRLRRPQAAGPRKGSRAIRGSGDYLRQNVGWLYLHVIAEKPTTMTNLAREYVATLDTVRTPGAESVVADGIERVVGILTDLRPHDRLHDRLPQHAGLVIATAIEPASSDDVST